MIMEQNRMEYLTPAISEHQMFMEGILCISGGENESYGGDPTEEESIF